MYNGPRDYKGHNISLHVQHEDDDCIKWGFEVIKPDGTLVEPDLSPYMTDFNLVEKWIDANYPLSTGYFSLNEQDIDEILSNLETK